MWWTPALLALFLLQSPTPDPSVEGMKALNEQRWDAAEAIFAKAIEGDRENYGYYFNLAFAQGMLGRTPDAIASYRKVLELKPGLYEAQLNLGILLLQTKQPAEAAPLLEEAAKQKPKEFRPVWYAAEALLASDKAGEAVPLFRSAVALNQESKEAQLGLARALAKTGNLAEADPEYRKAAVANPDAALELASLYEAAGKREEAVALYSKAPENAAAKERAGELLLESGKAADAIPLLEQSVQQSPTPANRYALGTAYNLTKQYAKAEPLFAEALKNEPNNLELRATYARVLREQRKYGPAAQQFAAIAQANPKSAEAWSDLAGMLILLENYQPALTALDQVRALGAEKPAHHYFRAIILDKHHMFKPALESYEKFLSMSEGKNPDEEFKARQRVRIIKRELEKR